MSDQKTYFRFNQTDALLAEPAGAWEERSYDENEVVYYEGFLYIAIRNGTDSSTPPPLNDTDWRPAGSFTVLDTADFGGSLNAAIDALNRGADFGSGNPSGVPGAQPPAGGVPSAPAPVVLPGETEPRGVPDFAGLIRVTGEATVTASVRLRSGQHVVGLGARRSVIRVESTRSDPTAPDYLEDFEFSALDLDDNGDPPVDADDQALRVALFLEEGRCSIRDLTIEFSGQATFTPVANTGEPGQTAAVPTGESDGTMWKLTALLSEKSATVIDGVSIVGAGVGIRTIGLGERRRQASGVEVSSFMNVFANVDVSNFRRRGSGSAATTPSSPAGISRGGPTSTRRSGRTTRARMRS